MTSPRRSRDRPIESVTLNLTFDADGAAVKRIKGVLPSVLFRGGVCRVSISGNDPREVSLKAEAVLKALRGPPGHAPKPRKALSRERGRRAEN